MVNGNLADWYNTNFTQLNVTGVGSFIQQLNLYVNGWLAYGFLFIIFLTSFGFSMVSGSKKAFLTSFFITFLFSIYFLRMSMISHIVPILLIFGVIIAAIGSKGEAS